LKLKGTSSTNILNNLQSHRSFLWCERWTVQNYIIIQLHNIQ